MHETLKQWSVKCGWPQCSTCVQCISVPPCAESCHTNHLPWWPDSYPSHDAFYPTSGYKCVDVAECLGCPACTGKPNILLILADDVGIGDMKSPKLSTLKNINALKRTGMSFSDAHTARLAASGAERGMRVVRDAHLPRQQALHPATS